MAAGPDSQPAGHYGGPERRRWSATRRVRRDHPLFEPFRGPRSGDFGAARIWRYRPIASDSLEVLGRHDDGSAALAERKAGRGRVLIWASALDNVWSDVPLQPVSFP